MRKALGGRETHSPLLPPSRLKKASARYLHGSKYEVPHGLNELLTHSDLYLSVHQQV